MSVATLFLSALAAAAILDHALSGIPTSDVVSSMRLLPINALPMGQCPQGLLYNPKRQVCDLPANVQQIYKAGNEDVVSRSGNAKGVMRTDECPTRGKCPAVDPMDHTVHLPHLKDCNLFCRCDHGIPKLDRCPAGLHFNPILQVCDWPDQAGCVISVCDPLFNDDRSHWTPASCSEEPSDVGDKCQLVCNPGYQHKGSDVIQCTDLGWNGTSGLNSKPMCNTTDELGMGMVDIINDTLSAEANLLFLLDESGSVNSKDFYAEVEFIEALVAAFPLSVNRSAGVITFDSSANVDISLKEKDTCSFIKKAGGIKYSGGGTDILRALNLAVQEIRANSVHNLTLVFLITDGVSSTNPSSAANAIKNDGNVIFALGVGSVDRNQLEPLSSFDKNNKERLYYKMDNFQVFNRVAEYLSTKYLNQTATNCS